MRRMTYIVSSFCAKPSGEVAECIPLVSTVIKLYKEKPQIPQFFSAGLAGQENGCVTRNLHQLQA
ncbi:MAG TPA: hypothetical protein DCG57_14825 [Candidatus Riflebacteria bacterium]|nr:hypothetical protein [Candidatus Riflebacteria bacterium]